MKIKEYRQLKGLNQQDMANILKISQQAYSNKELGNRGFTVKELLKLEVILGVSISEMFADTKKEIEKTLKI